MLPATRSSSILGNPTFYGRLGFEPAGPAGIVYPPIGPDSPHFMIRRFPGYDRPLRSPRGRARPNQSRLTLPISIPPAMAHTRRGRGQGHAAQTSPGTAPSQMANRPAQCGEAGPMPSASSSRRVHPSTIAIQRGRPRGTPRSGLRWVVVGLFVAGCSGGVSAPQSITPTPGTSAPAPVATVATFSLPPTPTASASPPVASATPTASASPPARVPRRRRPHRHLSRVPRRWCPHRHLARVPRRRPLRARLLA